MKPPFPATRQILYDFGRALLDIDYGIFPTFGRLFVRPEEVILSYFNSEGKKYFHPLKYLAMALLGFGLMAHIDYEYKIGADATPGISVTEFLKFTPYIWTLIFSAVLTPFYLKEGLNMGFHLVSNCYLFAQVLWFYIGISFLPFTEQGFLPLITLFFTLWGYHRTVKPGSKKIHHWKLIPAFILALVLTLALVLAGIVILEVIAGKITPTSSKIELKF